MDVDPRFPIMDADSRQQLDEAKAALLAEAPLGAAADPFAAHLAE
jgi:hypothetical protein